MRITVCALWLLAVGAGFAVVLNYQNAGGRAGEAPTRWPKAALVVLDQDRFTLVMFIHPQCPCTRASIGELNHLLAQCSGRVATQVWFFKPGRFLSDWTRTDLWRSAAAIPGVTVREDVDGAQARLFGAETSGHVLLYDKQGQLLFHGGITGGRGHAGGNAGESAILALTAGGQATVAQTPVYGCSLLGDCANSPGTNQP